jgi:hypothetical protein
MTESPFDKMRSATDELYRCSGQLNGISKALKRVGMDKLSEEIALESGLISDSARLIHDAIGEDIDNQFKKSQEATGVVLNAALAGIALAEEKQ